MSLQEQLDRMKVASRGKLPAESLAVMKESLERLVASGRREQALGVGAQLPEFTLPDGDGGIWSSPELLERGPLVVNFFRGFW